MWAGWCWVVVAGCAAGCAGGVLPPAWADARSNPCALRPRGWLELYWPQDGKCYTIYKKGHPCPETMELSPGAPGRGGGGGGAECRCPPGEAQLPLSSVCYQLFEQRPCQKGHYFAPVEESFNKKGERSGLCVKPRRCEDESQVWWPRDNRCYRRHARGPCRAGTLLAEDRDGLARCTCEVGGPYWTSMSEEAGGEAAAGGGCYEHYTRGPCARGQLFLPGGVCGCGPNLPHFHNHTGGCYQIDTTGPCPRGHTFSIRSEPPAGPPRPPRASCVCKPAHERWRADGACYRLYTRGPCAPDEMLSRGGRCVRLPCARGRLYLPRHSKCYRPGATEPCRDGEVVTFDFDARPSVDGVSHNGKCACAAGARGCARTERGDERCSARPGMAVARGGCHLLYTRGPCGAGAWLVPGAAGAAGAASASCVCRPDAPTCSPPVTNNNTTTI